eukprot:CAMPEP_0181290002 /NCGR_PEP_ID=MMETSP1101-20121128/1185_1 /TAXON_ID=46948 /ORGANISM="Rhodomonas abbreviata, Strain Caron Lab Isolate" /LENGTH=375 /DNA_ID=CAMNT_0023394265 /DNA_START=20 /DNA_END=1148 /DNA_ORIENTATION=-
MSTCSTVDIFIKAEAEEEPINLDFSSLAFGMDLLQSVYEEERLNFLTEKGILACGPEADFGILLASCRRDLNIEMASISIMDRNREIVKATIGFDVQEICRNDSLCAHALVQDDVLLINDTHEDDRFKTNHLVTKHPGIRFYGAAPISVSSGGRKFKVGCVSVMDTEPRAASDEKEGRVLKDLASAVATKLEESASVGNLEGTVHPPAEDTEDDTFEKNAGIERRISTLKSCVAFTARLVDEHCIKQFASKLRPRVIEAGTYLTRRGESGDPMFFLASGSCLCTLHGRELERLGQGQCFGEVSIINLCKMRRQGVKDEEAKQRCVRGADILALERCEMFELYFEDAWPLIKLSPNLWFTLEGIAARRSLKVERNL